MYRELLESDLNDIVSYKIANNQREIPYWCRSFGDWTPERVKNHLELYKKQGKIVTQVHEENGKVISFYAGVEHKTNITYFFGVVDLSLPNYEQIWRQDTARLFQDAINRGDTTIRIRLNYLKCQIVDWMNNEVNMTKHLIFPVWKITAENMQQYLDALNHEI